MVTWARGKTSSSFPKSACIFTIFQTSTDTTDKLDDFPAPIVATNRHNQKRRCVEKASRERLCTLYSVLYTERFILHERTTHAPPASRLPPVQCGNPPLGRLLARNFAGGRCRGGRVPLHRRQRSARL